MRKKLRVTKIIRHKSSIFRSLHSSETKIHPIDTSCVIDFIYLFEMFRCSVSSEHDKYKARSNSEQVYDKNQYK